MPHITSRQWSDAIGLSSLAALLTTGALLVLSPDYSQFPAASSVGHRARGAALAVRSRSSLRDLYRARICATAAEWGTGATLTALDFGDGSGVRDLGHGSARDVVLAGQYHAGACDLTPPRGALDMAELRILLFGGAQRTGFAEVISDG